MGGVTHGGITHGRLGFQSEMPTKQKPQVSDETFEGNDAHVEAAKDMEHNRLVDAYETLEIEHSQALEEIDRLNDAAIRLWMTLREVTVEEQCASHADPTPGCPICLGNSMLATMIEFAPGSHAVDEVEEAGPKGKVCPECMQGKHPNCTKQVLGDDDTSMVPCGCPEDGCGP